MKRYTKYILGCLGCSLGLLAAAPPVLAAPTQKQSVKKAASSLVVQGKVKVFTRPPRPRSVPYKDAVIALHLADVKAVSGKLPQKQIVVFLWGMSANKWTPAATYRTGQTVKLRLTPWEKVERKYGSYNRFEIDNKEVWDLDTYWAEIVK
jgi:hypothetical protein